MYNANIKIGKDMSKTGKTRKPGRVRLICIRCSAEFSTHSTNRKICYKCQPKCREIHYFNGVPQTKEVKEENNKTKKIKIKAGKTEENKEQVTLQEKI